MNPHEEMFDVVDEHDCVTGQLSRAEVHRRGLLHRAVHMFVFRSDGQLVIHRRSASKDEFPLLWTSSASGHVDAGETYDEAARRELREELGIDFEPEFLLKVAACDETAREHSGLYRVHTDAVLTPDPAEIAELKTISLSRLETLLAAEPEQFTPPFRLLVRRFLDNFGRADAAGGW